MAGEGNLCFYNLRLAYRRFGRRSGLAGRIYHFTIIRTHVIGCLSYLSFNECMGA